MGLAGRVFGTVLIVGASALAVATIIAAPRLLKAARPSAREVLRRGLRLYERVRGAAAEFAEDVEDLVAEVQGGVTAKAAEGPQEPQSANQA